MQRMRNLGTLSPKFDVSINSLLSDGKTIRSRIDGEHQVNQVSKSTGKTDTLRNSQRLGEHGQELDGFVQDWFLEQKGIVDTCSYSDHKNDL